jgi:rhodanese-related sulfurtransferase/DNA-binding transcriptional ArsR family regulator
MATTAFKTLAYAHVARIGKALSSPARLEILDLLAQAPRTVDAIATDVGLTLANASQHLQVLRRAGLVESEESGTFVTCRLAGADVGALLLQVRVLAHARLADLDRLHQDFLARRGALEPVDGDELLRRVKGGEVTVIDVRPREEFDAGHIPGAISVPLAELRARLRSLPKTRDVIAYCRGPYCVMALDAVTLLRARGFRAHRMEYGVVEWRARGGRIQAEATRERRVTA